MKSQSKIVRLPYLIFIEKGRQEAEEGEGSKDRHGVGGQGVGPSQGGVHPEARDSLKQ